MHTNYTHILSIMLLVLLIISLIPFVAWSVQSDTVLLLDKQVLALLEKNNILNSSDFMMSSTFLLVWMRHSANLSEFVEFLEKQL